ncbi:MAG: divalent metal cation transporter [Patescibacteria group bacterium]|jgi:NRAMP (natural resistance-associated macrophage protein)-like metal ion transporter
MKFAKKMEPVSSSDIRPKSSLARRRRIKNLFKIIGPGFITGASDDDPSGIATYSQSGARFGYTQLWTALFTTPFMIVIQEMCGRIGMVKGRGLALAIKERYGRKILFPIVLLLVIANTINIGADLGAMAASAQLIIGLPFIFLLIGMTILTLVLEIFVSYKVYAKYLKYLALSLFAYVIVVFIVKQDWNAIAVATFIPKISFNQDYLMAIVAILGTTISPYLFFWQSNEEVEEEVADGKLKSMDHGTPKVTSIDIRRMRWDTIIGMIFSNLIMFFIIATAASTLFANGITNVETAEQAALALRPLAGNFASLLFLIGIMGVGLLGVPVLAGSASYAVAELFGWKSGLYRKFKAAHGFYGIITLATLVGLLVNFLGIQSFTMLYYAAIINGIVAPILMVAIVMLAGDKKTMGKFASPKVLSIAGWLITAFMAAAAGLLIYSLLT